MAFAYVRIYDYVTNLYKTMVVKPNTTVKDLLTNALKKSNNSDADANLEEYHVIESLTTGGIVKETFFSSLFFYNGCSSCRFPGHGS
jgi:hypothetical protein